MIPHVAQRGISRAGWVGQRREWHGEDDLGQCQWPAEVFAWVAGGRAAAPHCCCQKHRNGRALFFLQPLWNILRASLPTTPGPEKGDGGADVVCSIDHRPMIDSDEDKPDSCGACNYKLSDLPRPSSHACAISPATFCVTGLSARGKDKKKST